MIIGNKLFDVENDMFVMGILNVTPDSFSDGGNYVDLDASLLHVEKMINEGADIIDVGGESTRPGHTVISCEEEINRVVPIIQAIKNKYDIPISIDTYKPEVAEAAINAGADMVNDIWGLKYDYKMAELVAQKGVAYCLMHNRDNKEYIDFVNDVICDLEESIAIALKAGISKDKIILDPGVGFAKSYEQNLTIINNLDKIKKLGYPVLLGTSRKSVIGLTLNVDTDDRLIGTIATTVLGVNAGCEFYRVHDCKENKQAIQMTRAIIKS